ncbi:MAG: DegV family protein [Anaerorhabdus sp.]
MNKEKIAIVADSCCDISQEVASQYGIYTIPLKIIYKDREYLDQIDITPQEVYSRMPKEIPTTSLPDGGSITALFEKIKQDGYEKVLVVTLSSNLSGTNNLISLIASDIDNLIIEVIDTKNIAIASGFLAIQAARSVNDGLSFDVIVAQAKNQISKSKVFFVVDTLDYLQKGGRIGLVSSLVGKALNVRPIIACNEEGIYYTVTKARGRTQSLSKTVDCALKEIIPGKKYYFAISNGGAPKDGKEIATKLQNVIQDAEFFIETQISPVLGVHTGPGLIGIAVMMLD